MPVPFPLRRPAEDVIGPGQVAPRAHDLSAMFRRRPPVLLLPLFLRQLPVLGQPLGDGRRHAAGVEHPLHDVLFPAGIEQRGQLRRHPPADLVVQRRQHQIAADRHFGHARLQQVLGGARERKIGLEDVGHRRR